MAASEPTAYGGSWYALRMAEAPARGPLTLDLDVDVCVIGGGLAGLTVALEVAKRGWSVAVLESRRIAWNASGRNAGFVLPGFGVDPDAVTEKVGSSHAKILWALSEAGADYVRRTVRETKMPGAELEQTGWLQVAKLANDRKLSDHAERLSREFGATAEFWPAERVRAQLRSTGYFGGIHFPGAFSINPLNYALGLAAAAEAAGARIFEETPALEIDPAGVRKRVTTPSARLRAGHVVLAGNVHIGALKPDLASTLAPVSNYVITTAPLGDALREAIGFRGAVSDGETGNHYRVVDGGRLIWSGRCTLWQGKPHRYARTLARDIARTYPQLGKVDAEYAWTGTSGVTVHGMPQIGELAPGVWLLSGFGAQGIATTAMGGEIVARAILDGNPAWQLFQPFDLVWAGGRLGRMAALTAYWCRRTRDRAQAFLTRRVHPVHLPEIEPAPSVAAEEPVPQPTKRKRRRGKKSKAVPSADGAPAG